MDISANDLIAILSIEKSAYNELLNLSIAKKDMMMQDDVSAINNTTAKENKLVTQISSLEKRRQKEVDKIADSISMSSDQVTIDFLIDNLEKEKSDRIRDIKKELSEIIDKLNKANEVNKILINAQLDYINFCYELMVERDNYGNNYGNNSEYSDKSTRTGIIDQKV